MCRGPADQVRVSTSLSLLQYDPTEVETGTEWCCKRSVVIEGRDSSVCRSNVALAVLCSTSGLSQTDTDFFRSSGPKSFESFGSGSYAARLIKAK